MPDDKNLHEDGFISANQDIDVVEIMDAIKKRIQEKKDAGVLKQSEIDEIADMELLPLPDFLEVPNVYQPHLYPGAITKEPTLDGFNDYVITFEDEGGSGVKGLVKKILKLIRKIYFPLIRFMSRPIYNELKQFTGDRYNDNASDIHKIKQDVATSKQLAFQSKEYIKLMHNSMNNIIVEMSKLKIDQELSKTKIKVLEDKIEFLENRERAIEKKVFK
jgi:hypothetical protein